MMDPHRLREQGATSAEKLLLASARNDRPPDGAARQMLTSLHMLASPGSGNALPHAGAKVGAIKAASWLKVGALTFAGIVGLGVVGIVVRARDVRRPAPPPTVSPSLPESPASQAPESPQATDGEMPATAATETRSAPQSRESGRMRRTIPAEASLAAELRLLDLARAEMDAHNLAAAQRALDGYRRRFSQGRLEPEATVLRLALLVQQGNGSAARSLAAQLRADDTYRTYQNRIRSLLHDVSPAQVSE
jgi:hypothetical protein